MPYSASYWLAVGAIALLFGVLRGSSLSEDDSNQLIGWAGETFDPQAVFGSADEGPVQLSESPKAYIWKNFISKSEAKHIAELAAPYLRRSLVGTNHSSIEDEVIAAVEERAASWIGVPVENQEGIQVLRYSEGQTYRQHMDGMGRMATMLIYLTDTPSGGETAFPHTNDSNWLDPSLKPMGLSACAEGHVAVKPEIGTTLLFYSLPPTADKDINLREVIDPASLHTGCPPSGEGHGLKWTATIWTHVDAYGHLNKTSHKKKQADPTKCVDTEERCSHWAGIGECEANPKFMVGEKDDGHCRLACGVCKVCSEGDDECVAQERERLGLLPNLDQELDLLFGDIR